MAKRVDRVLHWDIAISSCYMCRSGMVPDLRVEPTHVVHDAGGCREVEVNGLRQEQDARVTAAVDHGGDLR